jgi:hypothetical protein
MTIKLRLALILAMGCLSLTTGVSGRLRNEERLPAPGPDHSQASTGVAIAVIGTLIDGTGAEPVSDAVVVIMIDISCSRQEIRIPGMPTFSVFARCCLD